MAKKLLEYDVDVFVLDFDLEAPGLTYKFKEEIKGTNALEKQGVVDYINYFQDHSKLPEKLSDYCTELKSTKGGKGKLYLMTAGQFKNPDYWDKLSAINWVKLFEKDGDGVPLLLDLKGRIKKELKPQVLLIDSRTGVTASASITLKLLADKCVILAVNNDENLEGANVVLQSLASLDSKVRPEISFVLSRIPYHNNDEMEKTKEETHLEAIKTQYFADLNTKQFKYFGIIHHEREQGWKEEHRLGLPQEKQDFLTLDYLQLFESLFSEITAAEKLKNEKRIAELLEKANAENDDSVKVDLYNKALRIDSKNILALVGRALLFKKLKKWEDAIEDAKNAVRFYPLDARTHTILGITLGEFGLEKRNDSFVLDAFKQMQKATELHFDVYIAYYYWGIFLMQLADRKRFTEAEGLYFQALDKFEKATELKPDLFEGFYNSGATLLHLAKRSKGKASARFFDLAFEKLEKARKFGDRRYNLACFYALKRQKKEALRELEQCLIKEEITSNYVRNDEDWSSLKNDADFLHLLEKYSDVTLNQ